MAMKVITVLLSFQVLTLAEIQYKIPLRIGTGGVDFAADSTESQHNNLHGKPGQGYYVEMQLGTPPQKVRQSQHG